MIRGSVRREPARHLAGDLLHWEAESVPEAMAPSGASRSKSLPTAIALRVFRPIKAMKSVQTALLVYALGAAISFAVAVMIQVIDRTIRALERASKK